MKQSILLSLLLLLTSCIGINAQDNSTLHVVILGDSNTYIGGDDCDKDKGWNKWFKDYFKPASCKSYARSGATWTNCKTTRLDTKDNVAILSDQNVIYNQVCRLKEAYETKSQAAPDIIIIACGTNDAWFEKKRPGIYSSTVEQTSAIPTDNILKKKVSEVTSLAGSIRYNYEILHQTFPQAQIILLTPMQSVHAGEAKIKKVGDIIEECGKELGLPSIRQDKVCCLRYADEVKTKRYTSDGTHTNAAGAKINGEIIAKEIDKIIR